MPIATQTREILRSPEAVPDGFQPTLEAIRGLPEVPEPQTSRLEGTNVAAMLGDAECIAKAQTNLRERRVGDIALGGSIETKEKPIRNLQEAILWAQQGDKDGHNMLENNIVKEASERMFKVGHVSDVQLETDSQGRIIQNGQLLDDVQRNAFQLASAEPLIAERTVAEANNNARIKRLNDEGLLDDNVFLVLSMCPDGVSDEKLDEMNFFSKTKSLSMQATSVDGGVLHTESAFVAGVSKPGGEKHDKVTVEEIGNQFGVDFSGMTAAQIIDTPILVPKEFMKDGVVDMVKLYDEINGGLFFGQEAQGRPYDDIRRTSQEKEASFAGDVQYVKDRLISEAGSLNNAVEASKRLGKLVKDRMVRRALKDDDIDAEVFGEESAQHINHARLLADKGDFELAMKHTRLALATAKGGSCPSSLIALAEGLGISVGEESSETSSSDDCEFISKSCPKCPAKNVRTIVTATRIRGSCGCVASR